MNYDDLTKSQRLQLAEDEFVRQNLADDYSDAHTFMDVVNELAEKYNLSSATITATVNSNDWISKRTLYKKARSKESRELELKQRQDRNEEVQVLCQRLLETVDDTWSDLSERLKESIPTMKPEQVLKAMDTMIKAMEKYSQFSADVRNHSLDDETKESKLQETLNTVKEAAGDPSKVVALAERVKGGAPAADAIREQAAEDEEKNRLFQRLSGANDE